jgi:hypothetical protein
VLLKNSNNILPLDPKKIRSIAVLGINAATCEFGDYSGTPLNDPVSPLQGIINRAGKGIKISTLPWVQIPDSVLKKKTSGKQIAGLYTEEIKLAGKCDAAIVVLGINKSIEMEGRDRSTLDLPSDQQYFIKEIFKANPKTIVVLIAGSSCQLTGYRRMFRESSMHGIPANREEMPLPGFCLEIIILPEDCPSPIINPQKICQPSMIMKSLTGELICISAKSHYMPSDMD